MDVFIAQVLPKGEEVKVKKHIRRHGPGQPIRELDAPLYEQSSFQIRVLGEIIQHIVRHGSGSAEHEPHSELELGKAYPARQAY